MNRLVQLSDIETKALHELKSGLLTMLGNRLVAIRLFGSRARGDASPGSDIDIAVIVRDLTTQLKHRILDHVADSEFANVMPLSVVVFPEQDFRNLINRERRIAIDIDTEGIPL